VGLGSFASNLALVLLFAAALTIAAWGVLRSRSRHHSHYVPLTRSDLDREVERVRREFQQTTSAVAQVGEKVIAAMRPIESALKNFGARMSQLEQHAASSEQSLAQFRSSLGEHERCTNESDRAIADIHRQLSELGRQLAALADQLAPVKQGINDTSEQNKENTDALQIIAAGLAAVQSQMDTLSQRVGHIETEQTPLLGLTSSIAVLKAGLEGMVADVSTFGSKVAELERRTERVSAVKALPIEAANDCNASPSFGEQDKRDGHEAPIVEPNHNQTVNGRQSDQNAGKSSVPELKGQSEARVREGTTVKEKASTCTDGSNGAIHHGGGGAGPRGLQPQVKPTSRPKLQLIATADSGAWEIFAEVDAVDLSRVQLLQGSNSLEPSRDSSPALFGPLRDLTIPLRLFYENELILGWQLVTHQAPLFFRVKGNFARFVPHVSRGLNFAVVPGDWQFDETRSGTPPNAPEPMAIPGYVAHFFSPDRNPTIAFRRSNAAAIEFPCARPQFRLVGSTPDAEESMGPLFAGNLPLLEGDAGAMERIRTIVIGIEGRGAGRWRAAYTCDAARWPVPSDLPTGWYFARLYDVQDRLVDSLDFRYIAGLSGIDVEGVALNGDVHTADARIRFFRNENTSIRLADSTALSRITHTATKEVGSTIFEWQHHPDVRRPIFELCDGGESVPVTLDTDIIWWALVNGYQEREPVWQATPIELKSEHFLAESDATIRFRFPFPHPSKVSAFVGFARADRRKLMSADSQGSINLYGFSDSPSLGKLGRQELKLWLRDESGEEHELVVATVTFPIKCPRCDFESEQQECMIDHLLTEHHEHCFERISSAPINAI
jgi:predicted  nucleic acid-binding Zn-ribbon protein